MPSICRCESNDVMPIEDYGTDLQEDDGREVKLCACDGTRTTVTVYEANGRS